MAQSESIYVPFCGDVTATAHRGMLQSLIHSAATAQDAETWSETKDLIDEFTLIGDDLNRALGSE